MFTGIVSAVGRIARVQRQGNTVRLDLDAPYEHLVLGESIAVDGACLTVVDVTATGFAVETVATTQGRTYLGTLEEGSTVNLERAMAVGDRLGGHLVQGHVDGIGDVRRVTATGDTLLVDIVVPREVWEVTVLHGSITVNGVSLTVNALPEDLVVQVSLIPFTRDHTTLGRLAVEDRVHVEGDLIGKFVRRYLELREPTARDGGKNP